MGKLRKKQKGGEYQEEYKKNLERGKLGADSEKLDRKINRHLYKLEDRINENLGYPMDDSFNYSAIPNYDVIAPQYQDIVDKIARRRYDIYDSFYDQRHYKGFDEKVEKAQNEDATLKDLLAQEKSLTNQYPSITKAVQEPVDSHRHTSAGYQTSKAIENKVKNVPYVGKFLDKVGADKLAGFVGSNLFGIGHEAMTLVRDPRPLKVKAKESYEDIYNNAVGSVIAASGKSEDDAMRTIFSLEKQGKLKQGQVETPSKQKTGGYPKMGYYQAGGLATPPMYGANTIPGSPETAAITYQEADKARVKALEQELEETRTSTKYMDEAEANMAKQQATIDSIEQSLGQGVEKAEELGVFDKLKARGASKKGSKYLKKLGEDGVKQLAAVGTKASADEVSNILASQVLPEAGAKAIETTGQNLTGSLYGLGQNQAMNFGQQTAQNVVATGADDLVSGAAGAGASASKGISRWYRTWRDWCYCVTCR